MTLATTPTPGQTVQFGTETLDIGDGYYPTTSDYTAPLDGMYASAVLVRHNLLSMCVTYTGYTFDFTAVCGHSRQSLLFPGSYSHTWVSPSTRVVFIVTFSSGFVVIME